jgi:hypothetical protein
MGGAMQQARGSGYGHGELMFDPSKPSVKDRTRRLLLGVVRHAVPHELVDVVERVCLRARRLRRGHRGRRRRATGDRPA